MKSTRLRHWLPEWAPQSGIMLTWPHAQTDWKPLLVEIERVFIDMASAILAHEDLLIVHQDESHREHIERLLSRHIDSPGRVHWAKARANDTWARDYGPLTIEEDGRTVLLDFRFNAWGGKYQAANDDAINQQLQAVGCFGEIPFRSVDLVLEGGCVDTDGEGALLAHAHCLFAASRNSGLSRQMIENQLSKQLGIRRFLIVEHGALAGDDTDSHIDTLARFCDPHTIAHATCQNPTDPHHAPLAALEQELRTFHNSEGQPYHLLPLPLPCPHFDSQGYRLPATYTNFLIINKAVLMPTYRDPTHDTWALSALGGAFPGRDIIPIDCVPAIQQFGSLHCLTMQLPESVLPGIAHFGGQPCVLP